MALRLRHGNFIFLNKGDFRKIKGAFGQTKEISDALLFWLASKRKQEEMFRKVTAFVRAVLGQSCRSCRSPKEEPAFSLAFLEELAPLLMLSEMPCRGHRGRRRVEGRCVLALLF